MRIVFLLLAFAACERTVTLQFSSRPRSLQSYLARALGGRTLPSLDPFLLFDHFKFDSGRGFRDHPHRGFETVTYVRSGVVQHEDFTGKVGRLQTGDTQWMTAGRGIVHAEAMVADSTEGWQLWVNLKSQHKLRAPKYQELLRERIPKVSAGGVNVTVIAGEALGTRSATLTDTPAMYLDIALGAAGELEQAVPEGWNGFVYVYEGSVEVAGTTLQKFDTGVLSTSEGTVRVRSAEGGSVLLIAGEPTDEPVVPCGFFVMNSREDCVAAERDFRTAANGFERLAGWQSETQKLIQAPCRVHIVELQTGRL